MDYKTAELSEEQIRQLKQVEESLSRTTGDDIVLIAYKQQHEDGKEGTGFTELV
ncbi:MAG TPA: hypothetical protein VMS09_19905 [Paenibacillus sp.]|uniref:hypothetical protein n=1 Tax=Paenibacillus sp. TaxID=58172 RepID=UPI0028D113AD|nr:hypothetical protein [Paenibacillus sp.]HUC94248.1 hypothetical protein [Paenibacillus sp.]